VLGFLGNLALFRVRMKASSCIACGRCAQVCKAECLDIERGRLDASRRPDVGLRQLDASRCVSCLNCLPVCPTKALYYGLPKNEDNSTSTDSGRRSFLQRIGSGIAFGLFSFGSAPLAGAAAVPPLESPDVPPACPPGAGSLKRFLAACTGCGLCVSKCPSRVLRPSFARYGLRGLMVPFMDYEVSYCQYDCALCLDLCPTGALRRMPLDEKKLAQIGVASLVQDQCIVFTHGTPCGACAEHCPTGSVRMVVREGSPGPSEPIFDESICIGCGACHRICPALPEKAITVAGRPVQGRALMPAADLFDRKPGSSSSAETGLPGPEGTAPSRSAEPARPSAADEKAGTPKAGPGDGAGAFPF
jgi:formate hydrogenlyase subunit 6/NADH:ubiquinone oxidoreductase subunit I